MPSSLLESVLWALGLVGIGICLIVGLQMVIARQIAAKATPQPAIASAVGSSAYLSAAVISPAIVGRVEIPAIGLVSPLLAGDDSMSLTQGAGHIPGTALPGGLGTVGIAGHRDTHFRLLSHAAPGMDVRLVDSSGAWHYRVTSTEIVTPEQVSVLDIESVPGMALITCYPFHYIGSAPKRFIVHAALVSAAPDEATTKTP